MKYRKNFLDLFKKRKKKEIDPKTKDLYKIFMFVYVNLLVTIFCNIFLKLYTNITNIESENYLLFCLLIKIIIKK